MLRVFLALSVVAMLAGQQSNEAYPGQSNHAKPPEGWVCEHPTIGVTAPEHTCNCERHCDENGKVVEDRECQSWCWPDSCKCGMSKGAAAGCK